jgi:hypothetical protein
VPTIATLPRSFDESRLRLDVTKRITLPEDRPAYIDLTERLRVPIEKVRIKDRLRDIGKWLSLWDRLNFTMQHQEQSNWCWAATSTSVSHYYDAGSAWTQCSVAGAQTGRNDCCGAGASGACNIYGYLDQALTTVGCFDHMVSGTSTYATVDAEIAAGRPVGIRVAWAGGGAHFLAIIGTRDLAPTYVAVDDPIYGKSDHTWDDLRTSYQGDGDTWTHTYFTQA